MAKARTMRVGILCMVGVAILWAIIPILVKIALQTVDPFSLSFFRLFLGAIVLLTMYHMRGGQWRDLLPQHRWLYIGGLSLSINYTLFTVSLNYTTAGAGVLIVQIQMVSFAVLAAIFLGERLTTSKIVGMISVICGVVFVVLSQHKLDDMFDAQYTLGNIIMFVAGITWGVYALANKTLGKQITSFQILIPILGMSSLLTGTVATTQSEPRAEITTEAIVAILTLGIVCTGGGYYLISEGMKRLSAVLAGTITTLAPLMSLGLAQLILGEKISPAMYVAAIFIVGGILVMIYSEKKKKESRFYT